MQKNLFGFYSVLRAITATSYKNNQLDSHSAENLRHNYNAPFAKRGMKVTTMLNKISELPEIESLKRLSPEEQEIYKKLKGKVKKTNPLELEYSKLFATKTMKGNIALSIDPIDYILMSTNRCGWNSCYTISHGGRALIYNLLGLLKVLYFPS